MSFFSKKPSISKKKNYAFMHYLIFNKKIETLKKLLKLHRQLYL